MEKQRNKILFIHKYVKSFKLGLQSSMEYRTDFILGLFSTLAPTIIQYFLWTAIFNNSPNKIIYGYTYSSMIIYTILAGIVSKFVAAGAEWEIAADIRDGGLNKYLVKPVGYFRYRTSCFLGQKSIHLGIFTIVILGVLGAASVKLAFAIEPLRITIFFIAIIMAFLLNMLLAFIVSAAAFWLTEAWAAFMILNLLINVASGGVFPLDIFGEDVLSVLKFLPFQYTIYFPINILNGRISITEAFQGMLIQAIWIVLAASILKAVWTMGMKKYEAVGG